jgi:hypothetical protein
LLPASHCFLLALALTMKHWLTFSELHCIISQRTGEPLILHTVQFPEMVTSQNKFSCLKALINNAWPWNYVYYLFVAYLSMLSVAQNIYIYIYIYIYISYHWMVSWLMNEEVERAWKLFWANWKYYTTVSMEGCKKRNQNNQCWAEIQIGNIPNTNLKHYCLTKILDVDLWYVVGFIRYEVFMAEI